MSDSDWSWYTSEAQAIADAYPIDSSLVKTSDFTAWSEEGLQVS